MHDYFENAPCLYFSAADDGTLLQVNNSLCRQLGFSREELTGQKLDLIFTVPTRIFQQTHFFPLLKIQGHAEEIYITLQTKTGEGLPVLVNAERQQQDGNAVSVYTGIVVHNRKRFEDELVAAKNVAETALRENTALQKAKQDLQTQAELLDQQMTLTKKQNEELRQFSRIVTHDLQEPLRKLFLFTDLLETGETGNASKTTRKIKSVSEQMRSILSGLQQYIWLTETPAKKTAIDLNALLPVLEEQLQTEHADVKIDLQTEKIPVFEGDESQIRFLFHEIATNAVKFRKPAQDVTISITASLLKQNQFRSISDKYHFASFLRIEISDNGTGFDAAYQEQVFELFKRLHETSGRGIGLSLCKKIMQNHGGTIRIESREGGGTTVSLLLPYSGDSAFPAENRPGLHSKNS